MRWLETRLKEWNELPEKDRKGHPRVYPIWFDPWKYNCREDVWRGIIAEVILAFFQVGNLDRQNLVPRLREAAKQFGAFLGKGFLHALANVELKLGVKDGPEIGVKGEMFRDIYDEFDRASHPEKAYLNQFEDSLHRWIHGFLKTKDGEFTERIAVFIDDLDRCLPSVTLEVLEAIKLYLNIEPLMFIVGLDRAVVDGVVEKHYTEHGLGKEKSRQYLDKIFQVEIQIPPSEHQIDEFLDRQITALNETTGGFWSKMLHEGKQREALEKGIRQLSRHNPREVKRLLSSALLRGRAAVDNEGIGQKDSNEGLRFAQGVQFFLLQRFFRTWVSDASRLFLEEARLNWFARFSEFLRAHPGYEPRRVEKISERKLEDSSGAPGTLSDLDNEYLRLLQDLDRPMRDDGTYVDSVKLEDPLLRLLLQIPFSVEVAQSAPRLEVPPKSATPTPSTSIPEPFDIAVVPAIIRERVAVALKRPIDQVTVADLVVLRELNLSGSASSDPELQFVGKLNALQSLHLALTKVSDKGMTYLARLPSLQSLSLNDTAITNDGLAHLVSLATLQSLNLTRTKITDDGLHNLAKLPLLRYLSLWDTAITNAGMKFLGEVSSLQSLDLTSTGITDNGLQCLSKLTALQDLDLRNTDITGSGLKHLATLTKLKSLHLPGRKLTSASLEHLQKLSGLETLSLWTMNIDDTGVRHLAALTRLRALDLLRTNITDDGFQHLVTLTSLEHLKVADTGLTDNGMPYLAKFPELLELSLRETAVSDRGLPHLAKVTKLRELDVAGTSVTDSGISQLKRDLPTLRISK